MRTTGRVDDVSERKLTSTSTQRASTGPSRFRGNQWDRQKEISGEFGAAYPFCLSPLDFWPFPLNSAGCTVTKRDQKRSNITDTIRLGGFGVVG